MKGPQKEWERNFEISLGEAKGTFDSNLVGGGNLGGNYDTTVVANCLSVMIFCFCYVTSYMYKITVLVYWK